MRKITCISLISLMILIGGNGARAVGEEEILERANPRLYAETFQVKLEKEACLFTKIPLIGSLLRFLCAGIKTQPPFLPEEKTVKEPSFEDLEKMAEEATAAGLFSSEAQVLVRIPLISDLLERIFGGKESGFAQTYWPQSLVLTEKKGEGGAREAVRQVVDKMLLPAVLQDGDKGPGVDLPPEFAPTPAPTLAPGQPTPTPPSGGALWYTIDYRNPEVGISSEKRLEVTALVKKYWPNSLIETAWDKVYRAAVENGWNPAFVIALWIEESGASGVTAWDLGCRYGSDARELPKNNLDKQLECLFAKSYADPSNFEKFMCKYSEGHYPCTFTINPNFPKNLKIWYDRLI